MTRLHSNLIVLEGPDGVGKTSIAKAIATKIGGFYWHLTATPLLIDAMADYERNALENLEDNVDAGRFIVVDRLLDSEWVYGRALRNVEKPVSEELYKRMFALNPFVVFVFSTSLNEALQNHRRYIDNAHPYDDSEYAKIYWEYEFRAENYPRPDLCHVIENDFSRDISHIANEVVSAWCEKTN